MGFGVGFTGVDVDVEEEEDFVPNGFVLGGGDGGDGADV